MIRVADYIARFLADRGVRHVFLVTGGGAMHLNDAFGREPRLDVVACHHEQACAMAAESYYRMSGRIAAVNVTTGPGGTNAVTGVYGAWVDSMAMVVVSGQVKWETLVPSTGLPLRQLGDQEADILAMVRPITKYAEQVRDAATIRAHLEQAFALATHGRPGPVWLDVPMNVQGALVDPDALAPWTGALAPTPSDVTDAVRQTMGRLERAERPVVMVGAGLRLSGAVADLLAWVEHAGIPIVTCWNAHDAVPDDHPCYCGRPGTIGDRAGNFVVQNADLLLILGSRLNVRQVGYDWASFARAAYKIWVDIDPIELLKPTVRPDLPVHADVATFVAALPPFQPRHADWLAWGRARVARYPTVLPEYRASGRINPYCFVEALFERLGDGDHVVTGDGTACVVTFQAARIRRGQRLYTNSGSAPMGYDLPAAIGAWFADPSARLVCLAGDGSIQMNVQELATIAFHRIPAKIFVLDNQGYHSIRQTQHAYFPDNIVGCGTESGLGFPDYVALAAAYGIQGRRVDRLDELRNVIDAVLDAEGPQLCVVGLDLAQGFAPKAASRRLPDGRMVSSPLEDLAPFLSREELAENMLIPLVNR